MADTSSESSQHVPGYAGYWIAWLVLLAVTLVMISIKTPGILLAGIGVKAGIIALFFMHLRQEKRDLTLLVVLSVTLLGLLLFGLIAPDGRAM